jgi:hypothetical protein
VFDIAFILISSIIRHLRALARGNPAIIQLSMLVWHWRQSVEKPNT